MVLIRVSVLSRVVLVTLVRVLYKFKAIVILFYVHLPFGVKFVDFFDDLVANVFSSSYHAESIAESIESSACIALDDSTKMIKKLPDVLDFGEFAKHVSDKGLCNR